MRLRIVVRKVFCVTKEGFRGLSISREGRTLSLLAEKRASMWAAYSGVLAPLSFLVILCLVLWRLSPNFATRENLKQIVVQSAVVAILACGQTAVIIAAQIDLSVGAIMAFSGVAAAVAMHTYHVSVPIGVLIACATGLIFGTVNGLITAYGRIPSFIVTLGMMEVAHGAAGLLSGDQDVSTPQSFQVFGYGELFGGPTRDGIPYAALMLILTAIVVHIALSKTRWGRQVYAIGGNAEAARLSGVRVARVIITVFMLSGFLSGVAAVVSVSRASVASRDAGVGYELDSIAAAVLGGTSLFGGQGGIPGTILGAALIYTIRNGCALLGYGPDLQEVIIGLVIVVAVLYDRFGPGRRALRTS